jgi:putative CocE/NonD family hydrolase
MTGSSRSGRARKLPLHVRALRRLPAPGRLYPVCDVAVEQRIAVPAGDGVPLLTDHYIPLTDDPCPTLLVRSAYGRGFPWDSVYGAQFAAQGFHVLLQSCRGTGGSGGTLDPWRQEIADGQATVSWLREQEWFGGALGVIGTSYLGYTAWALAASAPPELRAMVADGALAPYPFFYRSGAFALQNVLVVSAAMLPFQRGPVALAAAMMRLRRNQRRVATTLPLTEAYRAALGGRSEFFEQWLTDPDPASPYWTSRDLTSVTANLAVPVSLVTGWDDVMLDQTLEQYRRLKEAGGEVRLVVGPWTHSSIFGKGYPEVVPRAVEEFRARLSGEPGRPEGPPVRIHVGGCGQWRDLPAWPPPQVRAQSWYLDAGGALRGQPPEQAGSSSFRYDPSDPTPSVGGPLLSGNAGSVDNGDLERRADVLTFTSIPLTEDLEILGPVSARLLIQASNPYHDVFARLCDVDPRGRSRNICDGLIRHQPGGRPAGAATITVPMSSAAYRFGAGHRIRLQVSGGAHPRYARNTGTTDPQATATRLVPADIQLLHDPEVPCTLSLPVANEITSLTPAACEGFKGNSADDAERQRKSILDHRVAKN